MKPQISLYGFDASTYVRTVRMVLSGKGTAYNLVPINVLAGEPRQDPHLERNPFGKVPVLEHGDFRLIETAAITTYLDELIPGPSFTPSDVRNRAEMRMAINVYDSYGYQSLMGVAGFHLFPEFVGSPNREQHRLWIAQSRQVLSFLFSIAPQNTFLCGEAESLADFFLAPACAYVAMTLDANEVFEIGGFADWWAAIQRLPAFIDTIPSG